MRTKTIKAVLKKKHLDWIASIEDEKLRNEVKENTIITGGCIASMLLQEPVNDYDLYFTNPDTVKRIAEYYVDQFTTERAEGIKVKILVTDSHNATNPDPDKNMSPPWFKPEQDRRIKIMVKSAGIASEDGTDKPYQYFEMVPEEDAAGEYVSGILRDSEIVDQEDEVKELIRNQPEEPAKKRYRPLFLTSNAITLSNKIQLVLRFYGSVEEIHENYDYEHCKNAWTSADGKLHLRMGSLTALLAKELVYTGSKYPVCSIFRLRKFIERGWRVNAGQILKMCLQVSELNLYDPEVLEDQLTGVDAAYFLQLISDLKNKNPEKIEYGYLVEIINRLFD